MSIDDPSQSTIPGVEPVRHGPDHHGTGNQAVAEYSQNRSGDHGRGLGNSVRRVLVLYRFEEPFASTPDQRKPEREIELHLTGHMERYMWSFDGKKYSEAKDPIQFQFWRTSSLDLRERHDDGTSSYTFTGMWMHLENGTGAYLPRKHTVIVKPAERLSVAITADAPGRWAFHCHLLFHMKAGMFRIVEVTDQAQEMRS